jgi:hypothetical protein
MLILLGNGKHPSALNIPEDRLHQRQGDPAGQLAADVSGN